jgi:protein-disulfide isomerase
MPTRTGSPRRRFLGAVAASVAVGSAGCLGSAGGGGASTPTAVSDPLDPPRRGAADAPVTVSVYVDFACPACRRFHEEFVPVLDREYVDEGVAVYEHRDLPLEVHAPEAFRAASAARAVQAGEGDPAFFAFASGLFDNQSDLSLDLYADLAEGVGADPDAVRAAARNRIYEATVERDRERGIAAGAEGTPTVAVDGTPVADLRWETVADRIEQARQADE